MIVTVWTRKGGEGKTTIAVNLATVFAEREKTLLIDLDEQGDASAWLGVPGSGDALARALLGRGVLEDAIRSVTPGLDVAAGGAAMRFAADNVEPRAIQTALGAVYGSYSSPYARVVMDCPPAFNSVVRAAWKSGARVTVVIPVAGPLGLGGLRHSLTLLDEDGVEARRLAVLSRYSPRRVVDRRCKAMLEFLAIEPAGSVRDTVQVPASAYSGQPVTSFAPGHGVTADFRALADQVEHG
jgi:cellulose biosynthesis protein BcsQ